MQAKGNNFYDNMNATVEEDKQTISEKFVETYGSVQDFNVDMRNFFLAAGGYSSRRQLLKPHLQSARCARLRPSLLDRLLYKALSPQRPAI